MLSFVVVLHEWLGGLELADDWAGWLVVVLIVSQCLKEDTQLIHVPVQLEQFFGPDVSFAHKTTTEKSGLVTPNNNLLALLTAVDF